MLLWISDFKTAQILWTFSIHFNVIHSEVHWRNPKLKSLNSGPGMPAYLDSSKTRQNVCAVVGDEGIMVMWCNKNKELWNVYVWGEPQKVSQHWSVGCLFWFHLRRHPRHCYYINFFVGGGGEEEAGVERFEIKKCTRKLHTCSRLAPCALSWTLQYCLSPRLHVFRQWTESWSPLE